MSDPNATIGPSEARRSGTRIMRAVEAQKVAHPGGEEAVLAKTVRNGLGVVVLGWSAIRLDHSYEVLDKGGGITMSTAVGLFIAILGVFFAFLSLAPKTTLIYIRVFGLNGLADKLTGLLPGGQRKAETP